MDDSISYWTTTTAVPGTASGQEESAATLVMPVAFFCVLATAGICACVYDVCRRPTSLLFSDDDDDYSAPRV